MITANHTPGPWLLHGPHDGEYEVSSGPYGKIIVRVEPDETNNTETLFNACLIAAAPDLLAACKWMLRQLQGDSGTGRSHWEQFPEYHAALAAIAKAEGGRQ